MKKLTEEEIAKEKEEFSKIEFQESKSQIKDKISLYSKLQCIKRINNTHYIDISVNDSTNSNPFNGSASIRCMFCSISSNIYFNSSFLEEMRKWVAEEGY